MPERNHLVVEQRMDIDSLAVDVASRTKKVALVKHKLDLVIALMYVQLLVADID